MSSEGTILLVGAPGAGKSTFLAALWHQLESGELQTTMVNAKLPRDREYLNRIRERWLAVEEAQTHPAGLDPSAQLHLRHAKSGAEFDIWIPNFLHDVVESRWRDHRLPAEYFDELNKAYGLLLFIHPGRVGQNSELLDGTAQPPAGVTVVCEWDRKLVPLQVQLVEFLQSAIALSERAPAKLRLGIILSAWDEVSEATTPADWLEKSLPMFDQFLRANGDSVSFQVYGVSALGGSPEQRDQLTRITNPSARVRLYVASTPVRDLTIPLEFVTLSDERQ